jgi:hypothetical protein
VKDARTKATTSVSSNAEGAAAGVHTAITTATAALPGHARNVVEGIVLPAAELVQEQLPAVTDQVGQAVLVEGGGQMAEVVESTATKINREILGPLAEVRGDRALGFGVVIWGFEVKKWFLSFWVEGFAWWAIFIVIVEAKMVYLYD